MYKKTISEKKANAKQNLLQSLTPIIEQGIYGDMTIREICASVQATTGLFYRHFKSKNEALAAWLIVQMEIVIEELPEKVIGKGLYEHILVFCVEVARISQKAGPECMTAFMETDGENNSCAVSRNLFEQQLKEIILASGQPLPQGREPEKIASDLVILIKGLSYEYYTKGTSYDLVGETQRIVKMILPALFEG